MRPPSRPWATGAVIAVTLAASTGAALAPPPSSPPGTFIAAADPGTAVPDRYIVVLKDTRDLRARGVPPTARNLADTWRLTCESPQACPRFARPLPGPSRRRHRPQARPGVPGTGTGPALCHDVRRALAYDTPAAAWSGPVRVNVTWAV